MGTIAAKTIIDSARALLQDTEDDARNPTSTLLGFLNEGQRAVVLLKPTAHVINAPLKLAAGTKQALPAGAVQLLDVVRNMGTTGTTAGRPIRRIEREVLDQQVMNWHTAKSGNEVKHWMAEVTNLKNFYVYPPANGNSYAEVIYSATPADITVNQTITLDDIYQPALINYVLYRAMQVDAEYASDPGRAAAALSAFAVAVTGKTAAELARNPNRDTEITTNSSAPRG